LFALTQLFGLQSTALILKRPAFFNREPGASEQWIDYACQNAAAQVSVAITYVTFWVFLLWKRFVGFTAQKGIAGRFSQ